MARKSRQSFLRRQREARRAEKAALKRQKRLERRKKASGIEGSGDDETGDETSTAPENSVPLQTGAPEDG